MFRVAALAALVTLSACAASPPLGPERWVVGDLQGEEFLNLRAGPGLGYAVIAGLPSGMVVRRGPCQLVGGTQWCRIAPADAPGLSGHVAGAYLDPLDG